VTPAVLLAVLAGVALAGALTELVAERHARRAGGGGSRRRRRPVLLALLARLGRRVGVPDAPLGLDARLRAAGSDRSAGDVMALKCGAALAGSVAALPLAAAAPGRLGPLVLGAVPAAAFLAPDVALHRRARARAAQAALELADVVELLRVAVAAGLTPGRALEEVGRRHAGLLAAELRRVAHRRALGVAHDEALAGLPARVPLPAVRQLAQAVTRAERHGAPLAPALAGLAAEARAERARAVRERAARAAPQIQLAVALLLVPAVLLLVAAALVAALRGAT